MELFTSKNQDGGTSLDAQWLGLHASPSRGASSVPGQGTRIPRATWPRKTKKKKIRLENHVFFYSHLNDLLFPHKSEIFNMLHAAFGILW